jgi:hypothetical protein
MSIVPEGCDPVFDLVENKCHDIDDQLVIGWDIADTSFYAPKNQRPILWKEPPLIS